MQILQVKLLWGIHWQNSKDNLIRNEDNMYIYKIKSWNTARGRACFPWPDRFPILFFRKYFIFLTKFLFQGTFGFSWDIQQINRILSFSTGSMISFWVFAPTFTFFFSHFSLFLSYKLFCGVNWIKIGDRTDFLLHFRFFRWFLEKFWTTFYHTSKNYKSKNNLHLDSNTLYYKSICYFFKSGFRKQP